MTRKPKNEDCQPLDMNSPYVKEINSAGFVVLSEFITCGSTHRVFVRPKNIDGIYPQYDPDNGCNTTVLDKSADNIRVGETAEEIMKQIVRINQSRMPW